MGHLPTVPFTPAVVGVATCGPGLGTNLLGQARVYSGQWQ